MYMTLYICIFHIKIMDDSPQNRDNSNVIIIYFGTNNINII